MQPVRAAAAAAPEESDEERNRRFTLLLDGLDLINQGVSVFDSRLKVVAANQRLLAMFGFPKELARPGTDFAEFMRYNAERGEYGPGDANAQVEERVRLALQFKPHHFERTRPDGTIVTVTGVPISHGGWVTIYTDVTQLRNHERELEEQVRARTLELQDANVRLRQANEELRRANEGQMRLEAALVHAQKMQAVGALTGGLAHNFNNLLTIVISNLAALRDRAAAGASAGSVESVESALIAALKGADITRRLLAFARRQALEPRIVEVNRLIANLLALSRHSVPEVIHVSKETAGDLFTRVDPEQLEHALLNLVLNACDAMPRGGRLVVRSAHRRLGDTDAARLQIAPGGYVELRVEDTGTGMDEATRSRVFEPFFTTKAGEAGSGLGLSMVYGFAQQSEGAVDVCSTPGMGTVVTLLLPGSPPPEPEPQPPPGATPSPAASRLVLLVEDDADVRTVLRRQLTELGYMVIEAQNGEEAIAIIDSVSELGVLVSDIVMPGAMDGRRLAALARERRPDLRTVLVTGYADGLDTQADRPFALLRKPCTKEELAAAIGAPRA
jgi:signal transduction histidine kinase/CheY-like chemotaxis protein